MFKISLISSFIRGCSLLFQFLLTLFLAKYLTISDYGIFGLIQSSVILGVYLMGFDLYVYANRELPKKDLCGAKEIVANQFFIYFMIYLTFIPFVLLFMNYNKIIPFRYIIWLGILLVFSHITQEIIRILIALQHPIYASLLIFLRNPLWIIVLILFLLFNPKILSLNLLLFLWTFGLIITFIVGLAMLFKIKILPFIKQKMNIAFIKEALKGSLYFFLASLCYNLILFSGRYFLKYYFTSYEVGIFSFFQNIIMFIDAFLYSAIIMIVLPKLIELKSKNEIYVYKSKLKLMFGGIIYITLFLSAFILVAFNPFIKFIGKLEMQKNFNVFILLLLSAVILSFGLIGHYLLYINHEDKKIFLSSILGFVVNFILNFLLVNKYGLIGISLSFIVSSSIMSLIKLYFGFIVEPINLKEIFNLNNLIKQIK